MATWPLPTALTDYSYQRSASSAQVGSVNVPTGSTAHTKGSWTQVRASSSADMPATLLRLWLGGHSQSGASSAALIDIGYGTVGNETILIENLDVGYTLNPTMMPIPLQVPIGSRMVARAQGARTSVNIGMALDLEGGETLASAGVPSVAKWTTYGVDTAASRGTAVTPGNSNNWGSWVEVDTTSRDHGYMFGTSAWGPNAATTSMTYRIQLAVATNTTEASAMATNSTLINDWVHYISASETATYQQIPGVLGRGAPTREGDKIYARATASGTAQTLYIAAYGGN